MALSILFTVSKAITTVTAGYLFRNGTGMLKRLRKGFLPPLKMATWFNTRYGYFIPELDDSTTIQLTGTGSFDEFKEAKLGLPRSTDNYRDHIPY